MTRRAVMTEANTSGAIAVERGKHSNSDVRSRHAALPVVRMPTKYSARDVEVLTSRALVHVHRIASPKAESDSSLGGNRRSAAHATG